MSSLPVRSVSFICVTGQMLLNSEQRFTYISAARGRLLAYLHPLVFWCWEKATRDAQRRQCWDTAVPAEIVDTWSKLVKNAAIIPIKYLLFSRSVMSDLFCNPRNYSPPGSSVHGISQARILEWIAISFSRGSSWPRDQTHVSCIAGRFFTTEPQR